MKEEISPQLLERLVKDANSYVYTFITLLGESLLELKYVSLREEYLTEKGKKFMTTIKGIKKKFHNIVFELDSPSSYLYFNRLIRESKYVPVSKEIVEYELKLKAKPIEEVIFKQRLNAILAVEETVKNIISDFGLDEYIDSTKFIKSTSRKIPKILWPY